MRWFAWSLMLVCALVVGCDKPAETVPSITPSSGTTDGDDQAEMEHEDDHGHGEGDHDHGEEGEEGGESAEGGEAEDGDSASTDQPTQIRFVADKSIEIPGMMCPYSCWPKVQETLAAQPGVEGVQLAQQPEGTAEGEIKERVVELKLNDEFDADAAIAALGKISFEGKLVN